MKYIELPLPELYDLKADPHEREEPGGVGTCPRR